MDVLSLLRLQCSWVCLRGAAAQPGVAIPVVRQIQGKSDGDSVPWDRDRRRRCAAAVELAGSATGMAWRATGAGSSDHRYSFADGTKDQAAPDGDAKESRRARAGRSGSEEQVFLPAGDREHVFDWRHRRYESAPKAVSYDRSWFYAGRCGKSGIDGAGV